MKRDCPPHRHGWPPWHGPWRLWAHLEPAVRERIVAELRTAYGERFGRRHPWDRVLHEAMGRRPGWQQRIGWELRLHYGAHLHRRLYLWFGAAIFMTVVITLAAAHFGQGRWTAHPLRALLLFGVPAVVLWFAAGRVARRIARPLYEVTRAAQELGAGNLKARVSATGFGFDETAVLSSAFNEMAARLERQLAEERELLASVSHELRTPLARIRLLVEIARQSAASGERTDARTLDEIEHEAIEIDALVGELLASARIEFQAVAPKPLEAIEVARRALERAGEPPGKLEAPPPPIPFAADPTLVGRALANLVDNARKHGSGLDRLIVRVGGAGLRPAEPVAGGGGDPSRVPAPGGPGGAEASTVAFEVIDRGRGFAPGDETRVFERFYQGAGADAGSHGSLGLGLALVKRIADAHGGRVFAANQPGGGARVVVELPIAPPARPRARDSAG
ncbi:MAG TPA: HAMP domain-containing sensor histidine kinase [Polyangia bacterium]|jgi:two-component system OmpR family sensor kinase|nr:HAMP domain-containing sensor histidine kinase [Polyangia bacterium]